MVKTIHRITIAIEGMTCAACVSHVEGALMRLPGIVGVSVNLGTEKASVELESRFGEDVASELETAFASQAEVLKVALRNRVQQLATENQRRLSAVFNDYYKDLVADYQATLQEVQGARRIVASVRSGATNPQELFRQVSGSGLFSKQKKDRIQRQREQADKLLKERGGGIFR